MHDALKEGFTLLVSYGGSSSSKTISALQYLMLKCERNPGTRVIVVGHSLPKLRTTCIEDFKVIVMGRRWYPPLWNDTKAVYSFLNGSSIRFVGADKPDRFRGVRADYSMFDEATEIPRGAFDQLWIRTRKAAIVTFNPSTKFWITDEMAQPHCKVIHSTYKDNPYVEQKIVDDLERKMNTDENFYKVYGKGEWGVLEGRVFTNIEIVYEWPTKYKWRAFGVDFGWNDPYAIVDVLEYDDAYYIREIMYKQMVGNIEAARAINEATKEIGHIIDSVADSASPRDINELQRLGLNIYPCTKGPDSILSGIRLMQSKPIRILASSSNVLNEFDNYKWKVSAMTGEIFDKPEDSFNHAVDAARYVISEKASRLNEYVIN